MAYYINDYFALWGHTRELEKKVVVVQARLSASEAIKSSIEVEVDCLNQVLTLKKKKRLRAEEKEELSGVLVDMHRKLSEGEAPPTGGDAG